MTDLPPDAPPVADEPPSSSAEPPDDRDATDTDGDGAEPPGGDGSGGAPSRGMLVERAAAMGVSPAPAPRRTGVFVDVEELRSHVGALLRSMLGGYEVDALGNFTFTTSGARIFVTVGPGPMGPHVGVTSILTVDQPLTPELAGFLLTANHRMAFGAFSYDEEERGVWLRHSLLGATLDGPELRVAVVSVASAAERVTATLRSRFGGGSFSDAPEERRAGVHPPEPDADEDQVNVTGYL